VEDLQTYLARKAAETDVRESVQEENEPMAKDSMMTVDQLGDTTMTLRGFLAGCALIGELANSTSRADRDAQVIASRACQLGDALLEALAQGRTDAQADETE
jgi:hypothetical protein